jgi:RNA polymerase sigma-70 factor (ECF subfamily)
MFLAVREKRANSTPGEGDSMEALFEALESPLLNHARRLAEDADMAQDIVQEAFLRLQAHFDEVREPRAWLYRTVHNLALNQRRHAGRAVPLVQASPDRAEAGQEPPDPQLLPDEQIARMEGIGQVRLGLANLEPRGRELLRLKFEEDLSYKEISVRTGLTVGHVGYILHHALKALTIELEKVGVVR